MIHVPKKYLYVWSIGHPSTTTSNPKPLPIQFSGETPTIITTMFHRKTALTSLLFTLISLAQSRPTPENHLVLPSELKTGNSLYCKSWRLSVETNNAGKFRTIPSNCIEYVEQYMEGDMYLSDSTMVSREAVAYAKSINISRDGKDCWVFDIDETLLSNLPYYRNHGYGSEVFNEKPFDAWVAMGVAPPLPASLNLYRKLQKLGFKLFLLTGRNEHHRKITVTNLQQAGFYNWEKLILRSSSENGQKAIDFKSQKRKELQGKGYRIRGSSGDQWSDLLGHATADRSFKVPNPMYYIS